MSPSRQAVLSKRDIEAAVAAYDAIDRETAPLPPEATRLLAVMFRRGSVCRCSRRDLAAEGFEDGTLRRLLRALIEAGFLSREHPPRRGVVATYHLHLPPRRQP